MKKTFFILMILLFVNTFIYAQTNEKLNCPSVKIISPPAAVHPGENMLFRVSINDGLENSDFSFLWTVDQGTIVSGQGTKEILVSTTGLEDITVNAALEIKGISENCSSRFSESGIVAGLLPCEDIDEFGLLADDDIKARLDSLFIRLQGDPHTTGYVESWGPKKDISRREKLIRQHINDRGYDQTRIIFVNSGVESEIRTKLWMFLSGADVSRCIESLAKTKDEKLTKLKIRVKFQSM